MCGEYRNVWYTVHGYQGSPPHVWGIHILFFILFNHPRITPTCVGNTFLGLTSCACIKDHPHMCGEYLPRLAAFSYISGSPPHVWGIQKHISILVISLGITPTCVGNTQAHSMAFHDDQDHPHMCGEYWRWRKYIWGGLGSPPHVWGIPRYISARFKSNRITPTCVGNTLKDPSIGAIPK